MKKLIYITIACAACLASFFLGTYYGIRHSNVWAKASTEMGLKVYNDVKDEFGAVEYNQVGAGKVIRVFHLIKDIDLYVYEEKGVKTIRAANP